MTRLLLVDDQAPLLITRLRGLSQPPHHFVIDSIDDAERVMPALRQRRPDIVLLDLHFPGDEARAETTGARLLRDICAEFPQLPVVVFTTTLTDERFTPEALPGADFRYAKDLIEQRRQAGLDPLSDLADKLRQAIVAKSAVDPPGFFWPAMALGESSEAMSLRDALRRAARLSEPLLIAGEAGSDLAGLAHAVHVLSGRSVLRVADGRSNGPPWVDAETPARGPVTVIVNGVEGLDRSAQAGLVARAIARPTADAWVLTTEQDLLKLAQCGQFDADLGYALEQYRVRVPPLRERPKDIVIMASDWLRQELPSIRSDFAPVLRSDVARKLAAFHWPGNVAQLRAVLARAVRFAQSNVLLPEHLELGQGSGDRPVDSSSPTSASAPTTEMYSDEEAARRLARSIIAADPARRHPMLCDKHGALRRLAAEELVRHLRATEGKRVTWKRLAGFLHSRSEPALRKMLTEDGLRLGELEFN
jgi:DNA-binding NtrC family response regulator